MLCRQRARYGIDSFNLPRHVSTKEGTVLPRRYHQAPDIPREVQLHFQLDAAQCSPIPRIPRKVAILVASRGFSQLRMELLRPQVAARNVQCLI